MKIDSPFPLHALVTLIFSLCVSGHSCAQAQSEPSLPDQHLGRLFHSPQQRAVLDELRQRNSHINHDQHSDTIALQGIVRRSSGLSTIWINGQTYNTHAPVASFGERSARVFTGKDKTVELKVGEQIRLDASSASERIP